MTPVQFCALTMKRFVAFGFVWAISSAFAWPTTSAFLSVSVDPLVEEILTVLKDTRDDSVVPLGEFKWVVEPYIFPGGVWACGEGTAVVPSMKRNENQLRSAVLQMGNGGAGGEGEFEDASSNISLGNPQTSVSSAMRIRIEQWKRNQQRAVAEMNEFVADLEEGKSVSTRCSKRELVINWVTVYFNLVLLVWGCLGWLSCIVLILGIYFDTKYLLIPWVFVVVGMMLLDFSHTIFLLGSGSTSFEPLTAILFTLDFFNSSLQTYSLLCVVSLYQEYKAGRGTADFEYINRRVPGVRYAPQPTGTSFLSTRRAVTYHETRASPTGSPPQDRTSSRKQVKFGDDRTWLAPPPPSVIHIESPKDSVSSDLNGRSGATPSEEGNSSGEWPGPKIVDTQPLIRSVKSTSQMSI